MQATLYGIGIGPGASDLVTVRAVNYLQASDVIYAPFSKMTGRSLAHSIVAQYINPETEVKERTFAMSYDLGEKDAVWNTVVAEMRADLALGKTVSFISLGDSMLYSTWVSLLEKFQQDESAIKVEIVPGITSFSAMASLNHFPLAMEEESLRILSCSAPEAVIEAAINGPDNLVLMKASINFPLVYALLERYGLLPQTLLVSNASQAREQVVRDLSNFDPTTKLSYFSTLIVNRSWGI